MPRPRLAEARRQAIAKDLRGLVLTTREIAKRHGVGHSTVNRIANEFGIVRGELTERIRKKADRKVAENAARIVELKKAQEIRDEAERKAAEELAKNKAQFSDEEIVETDATVQSEARIRHQAHVSRAASVAIRLLEELEAVTGRPVELASLLQAVLTNMADTPWVVKDLEKMISLPTRIQSMDKVAVSLRNIITLERQILGIDKDPERDEGKFEVLLKEILEERRKGGA